MNPYIYIRILKEEWVLVYLVLLSWINFVSLNFWYNWMSWWNNLLRKGLLIRGRWWRRRILKKWWIRLLYWWYLWLYWLNYCWWLLIHLRDVVFRCLIIVKLRIRLKLWKIVDQFYIILWRWWSWGITNIINNNYFSYFNAMNSLPTNSNSSMLHKLRLSPFAFFDFKKIKNSYLSYPYAWIVVSI